MVNSQGDARQSDTAAATQSAPQPERRGWSKRLAPSGGILLGLLFGALAWLAAFTMWRLFG